VVYFGLLCLALPSEHCYLLVPLELGWGPHCAQDDRAFRQARRQRPMNSQTITQLVPVEHVERLIHSARGEKVLLDADLAMLYGANRGRVFAWQAEPPKLFQFRPAVTRPGSADQQPGRESS
jgi:hypothetical protein